MFTWLGALPIIWQVIIPMCVLLAVIILSIFGKVSIGWGKNRLRFGVSRSCKDCSTIIRSKGVKASRKIYQLEHNNLRNKMNFAEQQLLIFQRLFFMNYTNLIETKRNNAGTEFMDREEKENNLFHARLKIALFLLKDEIRRSFKENGFQELNDDLLHDYITNEFNILINILEDYLISNYPSGMLISGSDLHVLLEGLSQDIRKSIDMLYKKAKTFELSAIKSISDIEKEYENNIDELLGTNNA